MNNIIEKKTYQLIVGILFVLSLVFATIIFSLLSVQQDNNKTYVGTIAISNYEPTQYASIISNNVTEWKDNSEFYISYQNFTLKLELDYFHLDVSKTISMIQDNQINLLYFNITETDKANLKNDLEAFFSPEIIDYLNINDFIADFSYDVQEMNILKYYKLRDYFVENTENTILSTFTVENISAIDVDAIAAIDNSIDINPQSRFSVLEYFQSSSLTNTQLSIISSGIQKTTANTNFFGFVFEQYITIPMWATEGSNVRILRTNNYDFSFYNDFEYATKIEIAKSTDSSLTFSLVGYPYMCTYNTIQEEEQIIPFSTIYQNNEDIDALTPGVIATETDEDYVYQLLTQTGADGKIITFIRTTTLPDLTTITERIYREQYTAVPEIYQENTVPKGSE